MRVVAVLAVMGLLTACSGSPSPAPRTPSPVVSRPVPSPTAAWVVGQCVSASFDGKSEPPTAAALPCTAPGAASEIIKVVGEDRGPLDCTSRTDGILRAPTGGSVCLRNRTAPHPGDPGKGGGILRVGDCFYAADGSAPEERPCYDRHGPGKIRSFLKKKSQCHDSQGFLDDYYTTKRDDPKLPIICHGEGEDVENPGPEFQVGECVKKPRTYKGLFPGSTSIGGLDTVGCGAKSAWAKVVANVILNCPAGATQSVTDIHHYPSTTCLRRL
jgi:hypothetical protein